MSKIGADPLYLLDENISYKFVVPFKALRYNMTSVDDVFPKEQLHKLGKKSADDPDIISWLGSEQKELGVRAVWITDDWEASKAHAKIILANSISVFWICDPLHHALRAVQQLQVITTLIEDIDAIYRVGKAPVYLKGTMDGRKVRLYTLSSHLMAKKLEWKRVIL